MGSMEEDPLSGAKYANTVTVEYFNIIAKSIFAILAGWRFIFPG